MKKDDFSARILIANSKAGRLDSAYSRLLGDAELGALISRIHATSISAGSFVENYIAQVAPKLETTNIPKIFNNTLEKGVYLMTKKMIKEHITAYLNLKNIIEPDYIIVDSNSHKCIVIELKDGDNFDTKKSQGEVNNLNTYSNALANKLPYPWQSEIKVCMFNQHDKTKIVSGFKGYISEKEAMSGDEFCNILGIDKEKIDRQRHEACNSNFEFVIDELLKIESVHNKIKQKLQQQ
ncbi:MAG: hypothetical protein SPJ83_07110 [Helicobacter sp.]|uniref:hypothetical protein n=1 Tax=Helicobacter sp. TaxID=218 RepID=UPI002A91403B|nr:hypothetical protein [Helicobacter sp.]MDY5822534.1 hypothetical protein [Helicobacter sp.]